MMENGGLGLELDLREEIKGEDQRDKREEKKREKDFWTLRNPGEKRRRKETREKGEKRRRKETREKGERGTNPS